MERVTATRGGLSIIVVTDSLGQTKEYLSINVDEYRVSFVTLLELLDLHLRSESKACRLG